MMIEQCHYVNGLHALHLNRRKFFVEGRELVFAPDALREPRRQANNVLDLQRPN